MSSPPEKTLKALLLKTFWRRLCFIVWNFGPSVWTTMSDNNR